jgi:hypothetical protein
MSAHQPRPRRPFGPPGAARFVAALSSALTLAAGGGCGDGPTESERAERRDLAALRNATARFESRAAAASAGYTHLFLNACMADPSGAGRGAMGNHYVNTALLDDAVAVASPEALLYEPGPGGQMRFVGVEYVIPKAAWTEAEPPRLLGRDFALNAYDLWALHVWVGKDNPSGLYADWNPSVSCQYATTVAAGAHH